MQTQVIERLIKNEDSEKNRTDKVKLPYGF